MYNYFSIGSLSTLEVLDVSANKTIKTLPDFISELRSLKTLNVSHCHLRNLPDR